MRVELVAQPAGLSIRGLWWYPTESNAIQRKETAVTLRWASVWHRVPKVLKGRDVAVKTAYEWAYF